MIKSRRISFLIMAALLVLIGLFHLGALVLTALFGYFALQRLSFRRSKALGVSLYLVAVIGIGFGLFAFSKRAYKALPNIAQDTIPKIVDYAEQRGIDLGFTDYASLKSMALTVVKDKIANVGRYAREALFQFALILIGLVVALSLYLDSRWGAVAEPNISPNSAYATVVRELVIRFETFFLSFTKVIGAQIVISAINTVLTAIFVLVVGIDYPMVLVGMTFLCGLLPIIGNILSNTLVVGVAFKNSPGTALVALLFLVLVHKLEYFLNSKIIGDRIKSPMWLTLIGIVLGEKLMGIPGIILAPVVLHYIKVEASRNPLFDAAPPAPGNPAAG